MNIALYFLMQSNYQSFSFSPQEVYDFGGMFNESIDDGEYYRLVAATYIHYNPIHIISNLAALIAWGPAVSERLGTWRFLLLYTFAGIVGNLAHYFFISDNAVGAGASGSIAGVLASLFALRVKGDTSIDSKQLISNLGFNLVVPFFISNINWVAHLGGFAGGAILSYLICPNVFTIQAFRKTEPYIEISDSKKHSNHNDMRSYSDVANSRLNKYVLLEKLKKLHELDVLSEQEYQNEKRKLLN